MLNFLMEKCLKVACLFAVDQGLARIINYVKINRGTKRVSNQLKNSFLADTQEKTDELVEANPYMESYSEFEHRIVIEKVSPSTVKITTTSMSEKIQDQTLSSWTPAHTNWVKAVSQSPVPHKQRVQSKSPRGWINLDRSIRRSRNKEVKNWTPTSCVKSQTLSLQIPVPQTLVETIRPKHSPKQSPVVPEETFHSSSPRNWTSLRVQSKSPRGWINPDPSIRRSRNKRIKNWTPTSCRE